MAKKINSVDNLREYFSGVMTRTHHAPGVSQVALAVMGGIIWKSVGEIQVMEKLGKTKNVLWMTTQGANYYFTYDHQNDEIIVKQNNHAGPELRRFDNNTPPADVLHFFETLI